MALKVAFPFRHHATLIAPEAKDMLRNAGFELICNDTGEKLSAEKQHEMIKDAFAVIAGTECYDEAMLEGCEGLKAVIRFGVGTDNFDLAAMRKRGIKVGVIANYNAVAEYALTLTLAALKNLPQCDAAARAGKWSRFPMRELTGKTVGIVGFGRIGRRYAELLSGFGVKILVYDPFLDKAAAEKRGAEPSDFASLIAASDIISLHLPATPETHHIINAETLASMKDGAVLINTSRGALVDEKALFDALSSGKLFALGTDVYEAEPVTAENPLLTLDNTVLSPHCAALTFETNYNGGIICSQSVINVRDGGDPVYPVK